MLIIANWEWMCEKLVKFLQLKFIEVDESWPYQVLKKEEKCYAAQIAGSIRSISIWESGGVKVVLLGDASFVKVIHQIVMGMVGHKE